MFVKLYPSGYEIARPASAASTARSRTYGRLYVCDAIFTGLTKDIEDLAAARGPCIQAAHAVVGQRHLARRRHVAPADQPHVGDGVMGGRSTGGW
jgi:hypothetical protein